MIAGIIAGLISSVTGLVSEFVEDKDKANELSAKLQVLIHTEAMNLINAQKEVLVTEMKGNWLQKSWRPLLMLTVVAIVANNYVLFPYLKMMFGVGMVLELPEKLWSLLTIGVGGYIVGRSGEKIAEVWKGKPPA